MKPRSTSPPRWTPSPLAAPAPVADAGLRDEVRQLVIARNARRMRRGEQPLDVEPEVQRQLRELN